jgi:hypothetical protein
MVRLSKLSSLDPVMNDTSTGDKRRSKSLRPSYP